MFSVRQSMKWAGGFALGTGLMAAAPAVSDAADLLNKGDRGDDVSEAQSVLEDEGYYDYAVDGIYGPITDSAVRSFQRDQGLVVDGIIGPNTRAALDDVDGGEAVKAASTSESSGSESSSSSEASTSSDADSSGDTMTMEATAYTAECAGCSGITATGVNLNNDRDANVIAVDPDVIPLGSTVKVEGMGTYEAADTGGAINDDRIDIHVPTKSDAFAFGRQDVEVTVVD
ncbi:peptidoglycan-binding protein [Marinococcus sp. PL1-022]|uniref:peptidoglycan-binding protein n=1 Tax=Marinococcus sp. PL1-022 TaxID=3095363 RepID=UPI0029C553B5|nr:peptidoglycan-binding protein [Marinococcus sp. PL1-022]MDX6153941.1 peptidoglycan-binding protein [Marinococcus sp. PL1-022]